MFRIYKVIGLCLLSAMFLWAQDREVGAYSRKSVTYVDALWLVDSSVKRLSRNQIREVLSSLHRHLKMGRFDYNPVPDAYLNEFIQEANQVTLQGENSLEQLSEIMQRTLVSKIVEAIELEKEMRAANLLTDQQKNSFITDKAKLLGITESELKSVMNSAYIYLPVIKNYDISHSSEDVDIHLDVGVVWFKLEAGPEGMQVLPFVKEWTSARSSASLEGIGLQSAQQTAFSRVADLAGRNLRVATQSYDDFKLSGQVMETSSRDAGLDIGASEDVQINHTYLLYEKVQESSGELVDKEIGFGLIKSVGNEEAKTIGSRLYVVSGQPDIGTEIREYPLMGIELHFAGRKFDHSLEGAGYRIKESYGPDLTALYQIDNSFQWFFEMGAAFGIAHLERDTSATAEIDAALSGSLRLGVSKRLFLFKGLALRFSLGGTVAAMHLSLNPDRDSTLFNPETSGEKPSYIYTYSFGLYGDANVEYMLSPRFKLGGGVRYNAIAGNEDYWDKDRNLYKYQTINWSGINLGLYFTYTPKSLFLDPAELMSSSFRL